MPIHYTRYRNDQSNSNGRGPSDGLKDDPKSDTAQRDIPAAHIARALGSARRESNGWRCSCPLAQEHANGDTDPSFTIIDGNNGKLLVRCHSTHADQQDRVIKALKERGLWPSGRKGQSQRTTSKREEEWELITPIAQNAPDPKGLGEYFVRKLGADKWYCSRYRNASGELLFCVFRFELPNGRKEIRPATLWRNCTSSIQRWRSKWPSSPLPLYRLERLAQHPDLPVLLVEGEKTADAPANLLKDTYVVVGLPSGANAVSKVNLAPLSARHVMAWPDNDKAGFDAMVKAAQVIKGTLTIVKPDAEWPAGHDIADLVEAGWNTQQLLDFIASHGVTADAFAKYADDPYPKKEGNEPKKAKPSNQADTLIALGQEGSELFHDGDDGYATVRTDGHFETYLIRARGFRRWLLKSYVDRNNAAPNAEAMMMALNTLEAFAQFKGEERKAFVRIGSANGKLYLDLCNSRWQVIEIAQEGWRLIEAGDCQVRFRRANGMRPLPIPTRGGSIKDLRSFVNVTDSDFILVVGWLISCYRDRGPFPVLIFGGEQGSGKSMNARALRDLVDPNAANLRSTPKDERDLMIAARNGRICAFDNLSYVHPWFSDALCRLGTGAGLATRTLYSDFDETIFEAQRPALLVGIEELATRGDLLDRALLIYPPRIADQKRVTEEAFYKDYEVARPGILGALLDAVSCGLRNLDSINLPRLPRMADFAKWISAAEGGLGWKAGSFMEAYEENREAAHALALESSIIAEVIQQLVTNNNFEGKATELLAELNAIASERQQNAKVWPKAARSLTNALRRISPNLAAIGIIVTFGKRTGKSRPINIERLAADRTENVASSSSSASSNGKNVENQGFFPNPASDVTCDATDPLGGPLHHAAGLHDAIMPPHDVTMTQEKNVASYINHNNTADLHQDSCLCDVSDATIRTLSGTLNGHAAGEEPASANAEDDEVF